MESLSTNGSFMLLVLKKLLWNLRPGQITSLQRWRRKSSVLLNSFISSDFSSKILASRFVDNTCRTKPLHYIHFVDLQIWSLAAKAATKCDSGTQTDVHPIKTIIVRAYEWNAWELRKNAIKKVRCFCSAPKKYPK